MKGINLSERGNQMDNGASSYRRFLDGDDKGLVDIIRDYKDGLILFLNGFAPLGKSVLTLTSCSADMNVKTLNLSKQEYCKVWGEAL